MPTTYQSQPEDTPPVALRTITYRGPETGGADTPIDLAPITSAGPLGG